MSDPFAALEAEADREPRAFDPWVTKRELQTLFDDVLVKAPGNPRAPAPASADQSLRSYVVRLDEALLPYLPPERRAIARNSLPLRDLLPLARGDLDLAAKEIEAPFHSLADGEVRQITKLDDAGRPTTTWHTRTEGVRWWMNAFAEPVRRYVSGGSQGIMTPQTPRPPMHSFHRADDLPETKELARREAYARSPEATLARIYADAGITPEQVAAHLESLKNRGSRR